MIKRGKAEKQAARSARLSAALRENLKRRKAQARSRAVGGPGEEAAQADAECAEAKTSHANTAAKPAAAAPDFRRNPGTKSGQGSGGSAAGPGG